MISLNDAKCHFGVSSELDKSLFNWSLNFNFFACQERKKGYLNIMYEKNTCFTSENLTAGEISNFFNTFRFFIEILTVSRGTI